MFDNLWDFVGIMTIIYHIINQNGMILWDIPHVKQDTTFKYLTCVTR